MFNILSVGLQRVKKNWPLYRCNPVVMPFAGIMGHDATENFTYCIQNMQTNFMGYLLQPLHYNFNVMGGITGSITTAINDVRQFFHKLRSLIGNIVGGIFGVFLNVIVEFQRITINIRDVFGKLTALLVVLMYTMGGTMMTATSWMDGIPGTMLKDAYNFCFSPDTLIRLQNGTIYKIKDIPLNSVLSNGARVSAVMNISNIDEDGNKREAYYELKGGENKSNILVTGHHLIYDPKAKNYIYAKDAEDAQVSKIEPDPTLACLITSNHTIPIGSRLFHDWEDNQS